MLDRKHARAQWHHIIYQAL